MNFKHFSIGVICLIIGLTILSPFEEIFILIPIATYLDSPELVFGFTILAVICLGIGIFLVGKSALVHYGIAGRIIGKHPVVILGSILVICIIAYYLLTGGTL